MNGRNAHPASPRRTSVDPTGGPRRRWWVAVAVLLLATVTGCSAVALPQPSPRPTSEVVPVLAGSQLDTILDRIVKGIAVADGRRDTELLAQYADGTVMSTRAARYEMLTKNPTLPGPTPVGGELLQAAVPTAADWPRSVLVVTRDGEADPLPELLVLTQRTPRAPYLLSAVMSMQPGATMPRTAPIRQGVTVRGIEDSTGVAMAPRQALDFYAAVLGQAGPPGADRMAGSRLTDQIVGQQEDIRKRLTVDCAGCFEVTFSDHSTGVLWAFDDADGGTIVLGELAQDLTLVAHEGYQQPLPEDAQALSGISTVTKQMTQTRLILVALAIPAATSQEPIQVVAGQDWVTSVTAS